MLLFLLPRRHGVFTAFFNQNWSSPKSEWDNSAGWCLFSKWHCIFKLGCLRVTFRSWIFPYLSVYKNKGELKEMQTLLSPITVKSEGRERLQTISSSLKMRKHPHFSKSTSWFFSHHIFWLCLKSSFAFYAWLIRNSLFLPNLEQIASILRVPWHFLKVIFDPCLLYYTFWIYFHIYLLSYFITIADGFLPLLHMHKLS